MWILVMFDLPVGTREDSRAATKFREYLLDEGFEMSQFSIYARFCSGKEQYENIIRFNGQSRRRQRRNPGQLALF